MIKFLQKYSLVLILAIIAGFFTGFKVFVDSETVLGDETILIEEEVITPTATIAPSPTLTPVPVIETEELITDEEIEQILIDLGVDLDNPTEEDFQKILDYFEN